MRPLFAVVFVLGAATLLSAQPKEPDPRHGVKARIKQYPQSTPKETLKSVLSAIEKADYSYLVAQLLDPKFVDDAVTERVPLFEATVTNELARLRDFQRANPDKVERENRIPLDPKAFQAMVAAKARERAFKQLLKDIEQKLIDDPQSVKEMGRVHRDGQFAESDPAAAATHPDLKGRTFFFKKIDNRWFLENRQVEEKKDP